MKPLTIITGILAAGLIIAQAVMGLLLRRGAGGPGLAAGHFHTGMLTAVVVVVYVALSLTLILSSPKRPDA